MYRSDADRPDSARLVLQRDDLLLSDIGRGAQLAGANAEPLGVGRNRDTQLKPGLDTWRRMTRAPAQSSGALRVPAAAFLLQLAFFLQAGEHAIEVVLLDPHLRG
jgi:hypothetical protein